MKTFEEFYEELQNSDNKELKDCWEIAKKENEKSKKIAKTVCLIIDILFVILFGKSLVNIGSLLFIIFPLFFIIILNVIIFYVMTGITKIGKKYRQFNAKYKEIVIKNIINNFYTNLEYFPNKEMPEYIYEKLGYEFYDIYESDDYFEAQINNKYGIQMAEILTQEKRTTKNSDGETETEIITKFHGLFAKVLMEKSINSELRIMENGEFVLQKRLNMDSSEFEKYFDVKATDSIIGMQILTADVMEELIDFQNKTKMKFDILIKEYELYLRFHSGAMFEYIDFDKGLFDKESLRKYFYMLNFTYNLSNRLISIIEEIEI